MANIGLFTRTESGFEGRFRALGIDEEITFVAAEPSEAKNAPAYRVLLGDEDGLPIGAAWAAVGDRAGEFFSVEIYSPLFGGTLRANLFRAGDDGSAWGLHTNLTSKKRKDD